MTHLRTTYPRSRRGRTCGYCLRPIPAGVQHVACTSAHDGTVSTHRSHRICATIVEWDIDHRPRYRYTGIARGYGPDHRIAGAWDDGDGWEVEPDELRAAVEGLARGLTALLRGPR